MIFEHFAINGPFGRKSSRVFIKFRAYGGERAKRYPFMTFLADPYGRMVLELYYRPDALITDF